MMISKKLQKVLLIAGIAVLIIVSYILVLLFLDERKADQVAKDSADDRLYSRDVKPYDFEDSNDQIEKNQVQDSQLDDNGGFIIPEKEEELMKEPAFTVDDLKHTVWLPSWDFTNGLNSLRAKNENFSSISPVWYSIKADGTLIDRRNSQWGDIVTAKGDALLIPSIAFTDAELLHNILSDPEKFNTHLNSILTAVKANNYDGIDIDYEMIYLKDELKFREFFEELATRLHTSGKVLSVAVISQWGDDVVYSSLPETRAVQDYKWLGQVADEVRIMTYDYTTSNSSEAGPIAPITWMEDVLRYAVTKMEPEKIWLGIHLYGYRWSDQGGFNSSVYDEIASIKSISDFQYYHDKAYEEGVAQYTCPGGGNCTHFFQDPQGVSARLDLAAKYQIKGVAYWRLGGEGDLIISD